MLGQEHNCSNRRVGISIKSFVERILSASCADETIFKTSVAMIQKIIAIFIWSSISDFRILVVSLTLVDPKAKQEKRREDRDFVT